MRIVLVGIFLVFISACSQSPIKSSKTPKKNPNGSRYSQKHDGGGQQFDVRSIKPVVPFNEALSKQGNMDSYVVMGKRYYVMPTSKGYYEKGRASWYGSKFHGHDTSNGEVYDMYQLSAAHKTLPLPSYVEVTNLDNKRKIILRVNDRGPFHEDRIIDLSYAAALKLDVVRTGTARVSVRALSFEDDKLANPQESSGKPDWQDQSHLKGRIYTQVGAYSVQGNAENVKRALIAKRFKYVFVLKDENKTLYRLRLGPHRNSQEAEKVLEQLSKHGYEGARTVVLDK